MPYLLAGVLFLWLAIPALRAFTRIQPARAAHLLRSVAAIGCFVVALLLVMRGRFDFAALAAVAGIWLIGLLRSGSPRIKGRKSAADPRRASRVRSAMIEMELDHASGALRGLVLAGLFQDRTLDGLSARECLQLLDECSCNDVDGERLLEAYLDRRFAGWRTAKKDGVDARPVGASERSFSSGPMTDNEAYEVLGLRRGATRDEISRAHRTLMKKLHPDQGGPTQLAARVNEAKDILLRRHS